MNRPASDENWHDETTIREIPDFDPNTPELVAARDRHEAAELEYHAWRSMARAMRDGIPGVRRMADDLLGESMESPDDSELLARSVRAGAQLALQQRRVAIANARGRAARAELDAAARALLDLVAPF